MLPSYIVFTFGVAELINDFFWAILVWCENVSETMFWIMASDVSLLVLLHSSKKFRVLHLKAILESDADKSKNAWTESFFEESEHLLGQRYRHNWSSGSLSPSRSVVRIPSFLILIWPLETLISRKKMNRSITIILLTSTFNFYNDVTQ